MVISPALAQLLQSFTALSVTTFFVNMLAPYLERYTSFGAKGSSTHDATLRALNLLVNIGLAFGGAALFGQLTSGQNIMAVVLFGIAQATGSHLLYTSGNRTAPAPAVTLATPSSPAPSLATIAATSAQTVADAVNAAIAAQTS